MSYTTRYSKYEPLFGAWYIRDKIGQGAIGQVYEIERTEPGMIYRAALKAITIPEGPDEIKRVISSGVAKEDLPDYYRNLIKNISNEFRYLSRLKGNSYIVNYEDHRIIEDEEEMRWDVLIKTELLTPLVEYVEEHPLSENDVLKLGMDICRALKFCGKYSILHRDIKPENIFLAPSGNFKLGDFGIARVVEETYVNLSRKGTYTYMAPEVFHGRRYDQRSDLYSLGLVMYKYMNNGRIPFMPPYPEKVSYDDPEKAFSERVSGRIIPDPAAGSVKLRRIILKACAYDPEDRYSGADEMLTELEEIYLSKIRKNQRSIKRKRQKSKKNDKKPAVSVTPTEAAIPAGSAASDAPIAAASSAAPAAGKCKESANTNKSDRREELANTSISEKQNQVEKDRKVATASPKKSKKTIAAFAVCAVLILISAGVYAAIPKEVTDITGIDANVQLYYDGKLSPEYKIEPDWFKDETISFSSDDEDVFTVSDKGVITAVSIGEADMKMKAKQYEETVHVTIVPKVTSIGGIEESYSLYTGGSIKLEPVLQPDEFKDEPMTFSSSDENVATAAQDGTVTAVGAGEAVTTIESGGAKASVKIYVSEPVVIKQSTGSSNKSSKKKQSGSSNGYFGDTEYF